MACAIRTGSRACAMPVLSSTPSTPSSIAIVTSLAVVRAYTTAPRDLQEDVEPSFKERVLTPLLDWSLAVGRKLTPDDYVERIRRRLDLAGNPPGWTVDRVTSLKFLGFAAARIFPSASSTFFVWSASFSLSPIAARD